MQGFCPTCKKDSYWFGGRGCKMEDARCNTCGGPLQSRGTGRPSKMKGRKSHICGVCGRRTFGGFRLLEARTFPLSGREPVAGQVVVIRIGEAPPFGDIRCVRLEPAATVCASHDFYYDGNGQGHYHRRGDPGIEPVGAS